ncbi:MAG: ATP synthase F0 subunit B [Symploca sp. SIO1A3]|nr:ATP synthase F0 subunit B [Symploca sp. SIO1A3]
MLHRDSSRIDPPKTDSAAVATPRVSNPSQPSEPPPTAERGIDIQQELNRLEDILFDSPHIPLTKRTLVDEEVFLAQLDLVRENLPRAFKAAEELVQERETILMQAEEYALEIVEVAEQRADQLLDEMGIIQQAELEANQIRKQVSQECETLQQQTLAEIERMRLQAKQELEQMRQHALTECEDIQNGADDYADSVLINIEQQLNDMLRVIRNGRQQLQYDTQGSSVSAQDSKGSPGAE